MATLGDVVRAAQEGDEVAFRTLIDREAQWAFGVAVAVSRSRADAEDVFQEALFRAWRDLPRLRDPEKWATWFKRIVINAAVDISRRSGRTIPYTPFDKITAGDMSGNVDAARDMRQALDRLAPEERALLALRYGRDLEMPVVADLMGIRLGTAKSRLHRTLNKLRGILEEES